MPLPLLLLMVVPAAQTNTVAITGVTVIDVRTGATQANVTVVVGSRVITAVGRALSVPRGARVVDGRGKFLIPGLWDMHSHHEGAGEASAPLFVANGVTGTRDMGSALDFILALREKTESGRVLGPRIIAAGPILDDAPPEWPFRRRVRTGAEAREAVRYLKQRGVDFIKVHDRTPRDAYFAIADEAGRQGLPFAGHVPAAVTLVESADAGQKSIEHLANFRIFTECSGGAVYRPEPCQSLFAHLARRRVWQTPTLAFMRNIMTISASTEDARANHVEYASPSLRMVWADNQRASNVSPERIRAFHTLADVSLPVVRDLHQAGVGILTGCDGLVPGFCLADELVAIVQAGLTPLAALQAATINPARFLGLETSVGTVERGQSADLVLLDANPLESIANVRRIAAVVRDGRLLTRTDLDAILLKAKKAFGVQTRVESLRRARSSE
jgi:imidazolonepropionase-like amidohydrolase